LADMPFEEKNNFRPTIHNFSFHPAPKFFCRRSKFGRKIIF
jgi:hypothetical protein